MARKQLLRAGRTCTALLARKHTYICNALRTQDLAGKRVYDVYVPEGKTRRRREDVEIALHGALKADSEDKVSCNLGARMYYTYCTPPGYILHAPLLRHESVRSRRKPVGGRGGRHVLCVCMHVRTVPASVDVARPYRVSWPDGYRTSPAGGWEGRRRLVMTAAAAAYVPHRGQHQVPSCPIMFPTAGCVTAAAVLSRRRLPP